MVAAGALGRRVPERGAEQSAAPGSRRGATRAAARSSWTGRRVERRRDCGRALGRGHAEGGPLRARPAPREVLDVAAAPACPRGRGATLRSADADRGKDRGGRGAGRLPLRAPGRVPGRQDRPDLPPRLPVLLAGCADPRLHGRDLARGAEAAPQGRLPLGRPDRKDRDRVRVRLLPARQGRARRDSRRLARPSGQPVRAAARAPTGLRDPPDARHAPSARSRAGAAVRDRPRPSERSLGRERRRDRRARPGRRRCPRDGVVSDLQAVRVRRAHRPAEALGALHRYVEPALQSRDRGSLPAGLDLEARHRARRDAGARLLGLRVDPVHAVGQLRARQAAVRELEPVRQSPDDASRGARRVVRHVLLRHRQPLLRGRIRQSRAHAAVGSQVRFRRGDGSRHRRRGGRPRADPGVAEEDVRDRLGSRVEPWRLDPAVDRAEGPARHAAADGDVLRDARERRQGRHAVPRLGRRAARREGLAASRSAALRSDAAALGWRRPRGARGDT